MNGGSATQRTSPERRAKTWGAGTFCSAYGPGSNPLRDDVLSKVCTQGETMRPLLPLATSDNLGNVAGRDGALICDRLDRGAAPAASRLTSPRLDRKSTRLNSSH